MSDRLFNRDAIIRDLEEAFQSYGLDGGISLRQAYLDDGYESGDPAKMRAAYEADVTHDWKAIPADELHQFFDSFSVFTYLDDKGWRYYLPAALRNSLLHPRSNCEFYTRISILPGKLTDQPYLPEWSLDRFVEHLELSPRQGRAIARALDFLRSGDADWYQRHPEESAQLDAWLERFCAADSQ